MAPVLVFIGFHTQAKIFCMILKGNIHTYAKNFLSTWIARDGLWNQQLLVSLKFVTQYEGSSLTQVNEWVVSV